MNNTNLPKVSPEEFVRVWQSASSLDEVSKTLGLYPSLCYSRAAFYRRKGVQLKEMPRKVFRDWTALQKLAESLAKE